MFAPSIIGKKVKYRYTLRETISELFIQILKKTVHKKNLETYYIKYNSQDMFGEEVVYIYIQILN